ncbi:hypothetical protein FKM82_025988 [Ascaphus truei]
MLREYGHQGVACACGGGVRSSTIPQPPSCLSQWCVRSPRSLCPPLPSVSVSPALPLHKSAANPVIPPALTAAPGSASSALLLPLPPPPSSLLPPPSCLLRNFVCDVNYGATEQQ